MIDKTIESLKRQHLVIFPSAAAVDINWRWIANVKFLQKSFAFAMAAIMIAGARSSISIKSLTESILLDEEMSHGSF